MQKLIKLMLLSGTLSHRRIRRRFWFFLVLGIAVIAGVISRIQVPTHFATSVYWKGVL